MQDVTQFLAVCGVIGTIALFLLQFVLGLAVGADARIRLQPTESTDAYVRQLR